jgi:octaprenyl-diphosphate synthase
VSKKVDEIKRPVEQHMQAFEQKFKDAMKSTVPLLDKITNYIIKRKGKQPNISFFAFTATPKQKTEELFGRIVAFKS